MHHKLTHPIQGSLSGGTVVNIRIALSQKYRQMYCISSVLINGSWVNVLTVLI